jgi:hypothetical protein
LGKPQVGYEDACRQWTTPTVKKANWVTIAVLAVALFIFMLVLRRS